MRRRIIELDYVRAVSMLAIIALHASSTFIFAESRFTLLGMSPAFLINQFMRFAVPAFVVLSGISLGYSKKGEKPLDFYKNRIFKILLPYVIWYTVYFAYNAFYEGSLKTAEGFISGLLFGASAPHLYFTVIIIQLYILFPLLVKFLNNHKKIALWLTFLISLYSQLGIYLKYFGVLIIPAPLDQYIFLLFPTWIFYFSAGIAVSGKLEALSARAGKLFIYLAVLALVLGFLLSLESRFTNTFELSAKPQIFVYTAFVFAFLFGLGSLCRSSKLLNKTVGFLSERSMTVYFVHILILYYLRRSSLYTTGLLGLVLLLISNTLLSLTAAAIVDGAVSLSKNLLTKFKSPVFTK